MEPGRVLGAVEWRFGGVVGGVARVSTTTVCTLLVQEIEHVHVYYTLHSAALTRPPPTSLERPNGQGVCPSTCVQFEQRHLEVLRGSRQPLKTTDFPVYVPTLLLYSTTLPTAYIVWNLAEPCCPLAPLLLYSLS